MKNVVETDGVDIALSLWYGLPIQPENNPSYSITVGRENVPEFHACDERKLGYIGYPHHPLVSPMPPIKPKLERNDPQKIRLFCVCCEFGCSKHGRTFFNSKMMVPPKWYLYPDREQNPQISQFAPDRDIG